MLKVPLEMPAPAAVPSVQIIRAVLREYHAATHTAEVEPVMGPASLVGEVPVLMSCRPDLLTAGREVAVLTWSDVGGLVLAPYGAVPDDPPSADNADTVDDIHAATTPTASKLLAMDANAKFPAHTVAGTLKTDDDVRAGRGIYAGATGTDPGDNNIVADGQIRALGALVGRAGSDRDIFRTEAACDAHRTVNQKITATYSGGATGSGTGGAYLICMGFRASGAQQGSYGVGIFSCVKRYNTTWRVGFTQIHSMGDEPTITMTVNTNTSTQLDVSFQQNPTHGYRGDCSVIRIGIARYTLTWSVGAA